MLLKNKVHETLPDYNKLKGYKKYRRPIVEKNPRSIHRNFCKEAGHIVWSCSYKKNKNFIMLFIEENIH